MKIVVAWGDADAHLAIAWRKAHRQLGALAEAVALYDAALKASVAGAPPLVIHNAPKEIGPEVGVAQR
jgi:hypothetical protein